MIQKLKKFEDDLIKAFKSLYKIENIAISEIINNSLYKDFLYFYIILQSRSFGLDTPENTFNALVPFGDMFNTSNDSKPCYWYFDDDNNLNFVASREINRDEEILINYCDGHNVDYLIDYGFTLENNNKGHIYNFEIKNENLNEVIIEIELDRKPSIKYFKLNLLRQNLISLESLESLENEIKILNLIKNNIKINLQNYTKINEIYEENKNNSKIRENNLINISRVLKEEKNVLQNNIEYIQNLIDFIKENKMEKLLSYDLNYYDIEYIEKIKDFKIINNNKFL